jgi:general secretion pathway protein G
MRRARNGRGFTLLELLIACGIIGIIAAIAVNNFYNAVQRARQKRTMADIRNIAVAWESRAVDVREYNAAANTVDLPAAQLTYAQANLLLVPTYMRTMSQADGWNSPLEFYTDFAIGAGRGASTYAVRSPGRDLIFSGTTYEDGPTTSFDCDIVYIGGQFVSWPEGTQQQ